MKAEKIKSFNPNGVGINNGNLFGLPFTPDESDVIVIPVPWEVTVSYNSGTADGPQAILDASSQLDLYDENLVNAWQHGISMLPIPHHIREKSEELRSQTTKHIEDLETGGNGYASTLQLIEEESEILNKWIQQQAQHWTEKGKKVCLLGGDHSTPLGLIEFYHNHNEPFGILQIDAHADLRNSYEGFKYSHASVMFNAIQFTNVTKLVQVGIRDICESEKHIIDENDKIATFFDQTIKEEQFNGVSWHQQCVKIVNELPQLVYISFDIDGLDPKYCPNTGTPVPGGISYNQALYLIKEVVKSGRKIISFDLNEVAPGDNEWDSNVGARLLYKIANLMIKSS